MVDFESDSIRSKLAQRLSNKITEVYYEEDEYTNWSPYKPIKNNKKYKRNISDKEKKKVQKKYNETYVSNRQLLKDMAIQYLGNKCLICENRFPRNCYDFHHIIPELKEFNIGTLIGKFSKKEDFEYLTDELDKCALVCANCHRIIHAKDRTILGSD